MKQHKADAQTYMTVGEIAKKMGVTVRTMQYYDKEGLLSPSSESTGGRRLYSDKDMVQLHQILAMKHLGFSLNDIKNRLISLETPADVASVLEEQADLIRKKLTDLSRSLKEIETLKKEVLQMQQVDFKKYASIIVNLQMDNDAYWLVKHFDDQTLDHFHHVFNKDSGKAVLQSYTALREQAIQYQKDGVSPEGDEGQAFAKAFWTMVTEFTKGDQNLLSKLMGFGDMEGPDGQWAETQALANAFINPALDAYFTALGVDPMAQAACKEDEE